MNIPNQTTLLAEKDMATVLHPQTNAAKHLEIGPKIITGADGLYVHSEGGTPILDACAGLLREIGARMRRVPDATLDEVREFVA